MKTPFSPAFVHLFGMPQVRRGVRFFARWPYRARCTCCWPLHAGRGPGDHHRHQRHEPPTQPCVHRRPPLRPDRTHPGRSPQVCPWTPRPAWKSSAIMQSEQGFAMRPLPQGAQGPDPGRQRQAGAGRRSLSRTWSPTRAHRAKPGDRLVLTDIKIDKSKIIFDLNGGPDPKHRFLRHIQIGAGPRWATA